MIIVAILYLLVGLFCCGVHFAYREHEKLEHDLVVYALMLLLWPVWLAIALGMSVAASLYE